MATKPNRKFRFLFLIVVLAMCLGAVGSAYAQSETPAAEAGYYSGSDFPLQGLRFPAVTTPDGTAAPAYDLFVEPSGRFWQPWLPAKPARVSHAVSFELLEGNYEFNGSECKLWVDSGREGNGATGEPTVGEGNGQKFTVSLPADADYATAWALAECAGNPSTGFDIWALQFTAPPSAATTPTDAVEPAPQPIVPSYWSNRPWVALVLTLLAIVAAIMFGVWAYKAFKATPAQKTKAIIFAIIAVVAGVAAIPLAIWFF